MQKEIEVMESDTRTLKRDISRSIIIYIIGCFCFISAALASLWFGYYLIRYHDRHELPLQLLVISIAGGLLLWEIVKALRFKAELPETFRPVTQEEYPALFGIIAEVTDSLGLPSVRKVYICPDATAAVFIQPRLHNILFSPKRNLVIGLGFLTQMDDDQIRAMLYHEFGHYVQEEMRKSASVYTIGQFSRSFVAVRELKKQGTFETQIKLQLLLFTYFTLWFCKRINRDYSRLARQMEYDADDVAVKYIGAATLQRTLVHAACIRYNYEVVQWGLRQLEPQKIKVDNQYMALYLVGHYSRPARRMLPEEVIRRAERLGPLADDCDCTAADSVRIEAMGLVEKNVQNSKASCTAAAFARWMKKGFEIYNRQRMLATSVLLEIQLGRNMHKLPLCDGSYKLLIDGKAIGDGNFRKGYTLKRRISPGRHRLTAYAPSGIISTPFEFETVQDKAYRIEMDYRLHAKDNVYDVFGKKISDI